MITVKLIRTVVFGDTNNAINQSLSEWGRVLKSHHINKLTTGSRSGRLYGTHRASAPGEYPASRSGNLVKSVGVDLGNKQLVFGEGVHYAKYLEHGTGKMEPRPHLKRSADDKIQDLQALFDKKIRQILK